MTSIKTANEEVGTGRIDETPMRTIGGTFEPKTSHSSTTSTNDDSSTVNETDGVPKSNDTEYLQGKQLFFAVVGILLAIFLISLDQTIVATANPRIASQFHALDEIAWITSAYFLTQVGTLMLHGQLCTVIPVKWVFVLNIAIFELGSLFCAVAPTMNFLIFGRAFAGIGGAGLFVSALAIIGESIHITKRSLVFSGFSIVFGVASVAGPLIGGVFSDQVTWRLCFYINLPFGLITILAILTTLKPTVPSAVASGKNTHPWWRRVLGLDWIGSALTLLAVSLLLVGLQVGGNTSPWNSSEVIGVFIGCGVTVIVLAVWEWYMGDEATLPMGLLNNRTQLGVCVLVFMMMMCNLVATYYLPLDFQATEGHSAEKSGIDLLPFMISVVLVAFVVGGVISKIAHYWTFLLIGPCLTAVGAGLLFTLKDGIPSGKMIGYQILYGAGIGACLNFSMIAVQAEYSAQGRAHLIPQATALVTFAQFLGGDLGISIGSTLFINELRKNLAKLAPNADAKAVSSSVQAIFQLPASEQAGAILAYSRSLSEIYTLSMAAAAIAAFSALIIKDYSLKEQEKSSEEAA